MLWQVLLAPSKLKVRKDLLHLEQALALVVSQALTHLVTFKLFGSSHVTAVLADLSHATQLIKFENLDDS